jgi:protocatechuate 3,4-dioxygenase, alpha subunit
MTPGQTPSQTAGPFFSLGLCTRAQNALVAPSDPDAVHIAGRVLDGEGEGVPDALVEIWQSDAGGVHRNDFGWGRCGTDGEGGYSFSTVKPGPVEGQAPQLTVLVFARGLLKAVHTRMYFPDEEEANAADPVLSALDPAERATLVAQPEDGELRFDIRLQGEDQTTFFAV